MQKKEVYDRETSERICELARLFGLGYEVFDTKEDFKNWLITPFKALGNKKLFDLLDSSLEANIILNPLYKEFGKVEILEFISLSIDERLKSDNRK